MLHYIKCQIAEINQLFITGTYGISGAAGKFVAYYNELASEKTTKSLGTDITSGIKEINLSDFENNFVKKNSWFSTDTLLKNLSMAKNFSPIAQANQLNGYVNAYVQKKFLFYLMNSSETENNLSVNPE